ncbi:MAG: hypothetical protein QOD77_916 [Thermoplasmata archaeon]|jgi:hypothetical protein|nr:hypothetical protein [Thermoplasmata archaeon]
MRALLPVLLLATALLAGCTNPDEPLPPQPAGFSMEPSFASVQPPRAVGLEPVARLTWDNGTAYPIGSGNVVAGDYVFGSAQNEGFFIADISDPTHPKLVYDSPDDSETPYSRKADVIAHPDGRRTLVLATQTNGMHFWDVTDVHNPRFASIVEFEANHNIAVVPGTEYVFNNPSKGVGGSNALIDASDPYNPRILGDFGTHGCHGTTFSGVFGQGTLRAYCAAIQRTEIWDLTELDVTKRDFNIKLLGFVSDLDSPIVGSPIANPPIPPNPTGIGTTPARNLHHFAAASNDGDILLIGDEHRGGGNPGACFAQEETTGLSTPLGALWFYDISNPADPVMLSWISPPTVAPQAPAVPTEPHQDPSVAGQAAGSAYTAVPNCTAHFGTVLPGEDKIVIAWYSAGVLLIDFSDPKAPVMLDQYQAEGINTWNARAWNGYVFTGDLGRGMEVLKLV